MISKKWRIFFCIFISGIFIAMNQFKITPVNADVMAALDLNRAQLGMLMTAFSVAEAIVILPAALILCKLGERKTTLLALVCAFAGTMLGGAANTYGLLLASRVIEGVGIALIAVVLPIIPVRYFEAGEQGKPMGIQAGYISLSVLLIFNLAVPLLNTFGTIKSIWFFTGVLYLIMMVAVFFLVEDSAQQEDEKPNYRAVAKNGMVWILALCFLGIGFRDLSYTNWSADFYKQVYEIGDSASNLATSMSYAGLWLGSLLSGILFDKGVKGEHLIAVSGSALIILGIFCFTIPGALIIPYMLLTGFAMGLGVSCIYMKAAAYSANGTDATFAIALTNLFLYIGYFLAPPISGAVIDAFGWSADTYVVEIGSVIIALCGVALTLLGRRRKNTL